MDTQKPFLSSDDRFPSFLPCANCGNEFEQRRSWQSFCDRKCSAEFHARAKQRGGPLAPLVLAWNATRHARPGTEEAEICRYARSEISAIAGLFNEEDDTEGRASALEFVKGLMRSGTLYMDRARR